MLTITIKMICGRRWTRHLCTLAAIGAASAPCLGREALTRIAHAERPVDERLDLDTVALGKQ